MLLLWPTTFKGAVLLTPPPSPNSRRVNFTRKILKSKNQKSVRSGPEPKFITTHRDENGGLRRVHFGSIAMWPIPAFFAFSIH